MAEYQLAQAQIDKVIAGDNAAAPDAANGAPAIALGGGGNGNDPANAGEGVDNGGDNPANAGEGGDANYGDDAIGQADGAAAAGASGPAPDRGGGGATGPADGVGVAGVAGVDIAVGADAGHDVERDVDGDTARVAPFGEGGEDRKHKWGAERDLKAGNAELKGGEADQNVRRSKRRRCQVNGRIGNVISLGAKKSRTKETQSSKETIKYRYLVDLSNTPD